METGRIRWMKVLQKRGKVDLDTKVKNYKIAKWYKTKNALWYYKKDAPTKQLYMPFNPLVKEDPLPHIEETDYNTFFNLQGKKTSRKVVEMCSERSRLESFYFKSFASIV